MDNSVKTQKSLMERVNKVINLSKEGNFEEAERLIEEIAKDKSFYELYSIYESNIVPKTIRAYALTKIKDSEIKEYLRDLKNKKRDSYSVMNLLALFKLTTGYQEMIFSAMEKIIKEKGRGFSSLLEVIENARYNKIFANALKMLLENYDKERIHYSSVLYEFSNSFLIKKEPEIVNKELSLEKVLYDVAIGLKKTHGLEEFFNNILYFLDPSNEKKERAIPDRLLLGMGVIYSLKHKIELDLNLIKSNYFDLTHLGVFKDKKTSQLFEKLKNVDSSAYFALLSSIHKGEASLIANLYKEREETLRGTVLKLVVRFFPENLKREFFEKISKEEIKVEQLEPYFNKGKIRELVGEKKFERMRFA